MQLTKNADTSKYHYKGYGICFDESEQFTHTITEVLVVVLIVVVLILHWLET